MNNSDHLHENVYLHFAVFLDDNDYWEVDLSYGHRGTTQNDV